MGGLACKEVIDGGNNGGMAEDLIGAIRRLQTTVAAVSQTIAELEEYLTPDEKKAALKWAYDLCDFGNEDMQKMGDKIRAFTKRYADFYIDLAKKHEYSEE